MSDPVSASAAIARAKFSHGHFANSSSSMWRALANACLAGSADLGGFAHTRAQSHPCRTCSLLLLELLPAAPWREAATPLERLLVVVALRNLPAAQVAEPDASLRGACEEFPLGAGPAAGANLEEFIASARAQTLLKTLQCNVRGGDFPAARRLAADELALHLRGLCQMC